MMNWIFDHFQIVVLVALGVGSVLKSLWEAKAKRNGEPDGEYDPGEVFGPDAEENSRPMRPSVPPPLARQAVPPPLRQSGYDEAVASERAQVLKHQQDLAEHMRRLRETKATTTGGAAATRARMSAKGAKKPIAKAALGIRDRLHDPREVRQAFVMREILDAPVSLR